MKWVNVRKLAPAAILLFGGLSCDDSFVNSTASDGGAGGGVTTNGGNGATSTSSSGGNAMGGGNAVGGNAVGGGGMNQGGAVPNPICVNGCTPSLFYQHGIVLTGAIATTPARVYYAVGGNFLGRLPKTTLVGESVQNGSATQALAGDGTAVWWSRSPNGNCSNQFGGVYTESVSMSSMLVACSVTDDNMSVSPIELDLLAVSDVHVCAGDPQAATVDCYVKANVGSTGVRIFSGGASQELRGIALLDGYAYFTIVDSSDPAKTGLHRVALSGIPTSEVSQVDADEPVTGSLQASGGQLWWTATMGQPNEVGVLRHYNPATASYVVLSQRARLLAPSEDWLYGVDDLGEVFALRGDGFGDSLPLGTAPMGTTGMTVDPFPPAGLLFVSGSEILVMR